MSHTPDAIMSVFYYQLPTFALILPMRFSTALLAAEKPNLHAVADMFMLVLSG